jgi:F-type H+-transporting ATPase subunit b
MLIDWFTVGAQALNFLILVWLLKHFLYKPILDAIDAREKGIAAQLADATTKKAEAQKEHAEFQSKNKAFDEQRGALLGKATDEAKTEREHLLDQARKDSDALRAAEAAALQSDQKRLGTEIVRLTKEEVFGIARKTLADLATVSLEERMGEVFTRRLRQMDGKAKASLGAALKADPEPAILRSAFVLPADQQAAIQNALNETFSAQVRVKFETAPEAVCGIELSAGGQKVAWSIADYLKSLDSKVGALLDAQAAPLPKATPKPDTQPKPETTPQLEAEAHAVAK